MDESSNQGMKIIQAHNYYQIKGGEDTVVAAEKALLEENGHTVITYYKRNAEINTYSTFEKLQLIKRTRWSKKTDTEFSALIEKEKPDICHVHNFLPLISPAIFHACQAQNIPVVMTLHNYRLICTNGLFLRNEEVCELCLGKSARQSIAKKCYRNSYVQTYAVAQMLEKHKKMGTWQDKIDQYICLTEFAKSKFEAHGLPSSKLTVKPNFIPQLNVNKPTQSDNYFIYVGRLTKSKGVHLFQELASSLKIPLKLVGEGDLTESLKNIDNIDLLGKQSSEKTLELIAGAKALILPSLWYEGMPMTILEAFALKTPVITSKIGAMESMIQHGKNGLLFQPGSVPELIENLNFARQSVDKMNAIAEAAYADYDQLYSPAANYKQLMAIYTSTIGEKHG